MSGYQCKCHLCGKIFFSGNLHEWVYKMDGYYFCSWSCFRRYEKEQELMKREVLRNAKRKSVHR